MQLFSTDSKNSVLNDQTEEIPSTSVNKAYHNFQDEHNYAKHFNNKNEASILDDLFEDVALHSRSFDYPSSSFF